MSLNNKDYGVSFVRMLSMIMIISCHIFQFFGNELAYWLNSGVQIFLFISGFLYGQRLKHCDFNFIKRSFKKILVDYYVCIFLCLGLYALFIPGILPLKELVKMFMCYGFGNISSVSHLWFVPIILFCYLITPLLGVIINEQLERIDIKTIVKLVTGIGLIYVLLKLFFSYFTAELVICYCIGLIVGKMKTIYDKWQRTLASFIVPIALLINSIRIYLNYFFEITLEGKMTKVLYESFEQFTRVALGITLFLVFYAIYHCGMKKMKGLHQILEWSDTYSYDIYLGHQTWILGAFSILQTSFPLIIRIILVVVACVLEGGVIHAISSAFINTIKKVRCKEQV